MYASASGLHDTASRLQGAARRRFEELGSTLDPYEATMGEADQARPTKVLGADAFEAALQAGRALTNTEINQLVLQGPPSSD
jgi:hypothetical protein